MPLSEPLSLRTYSRVKVSGWNQDEVFFVEKSELGNDEFTGKHISLEHMLADGAIIFVRVLQPTSSHRNSSIAYEKYNDAYGKTIASLTRRAQTLLLQHHWPGNARELENVISTACITAMGDFIDISDLPEHLQHRNSSLAGDEDRHPLSLDEVRKHHIQKVLHTCNGSRLRAAQTLGIGLTNLYRYLSATASTLHACAHLRRHRLSHPMNRALFGYFAWFFVRRFAAGEFFLSG